MSIISDSMLRNNDNDRASAQYASSQPYSQTYSDEGSSNDNQQGLLERIFNGLGAASDWISNNVEYVENSPVGQWIGNNVEYVENSPVGQALAPANSIFQNWPALLGLAANAAVTPQDNDTFSGSLYDAGVNGAANTVGNIADLMHKDDLAAAMYALANKTQDNAPVQADWDWNYITNPHGLTRSFGNAIGSMAPLLPAAALAPESLVAAAGRLSPWLANGVRYGFTAIPEAMAEGGQTRREAIEDGLDHPDLRAFGTLAKNLPLLAASNTLEGAILGGGLGKALAGKAGEGVFSRVAKAPFRATPSALAEGLQNGLEEGLQQGIQNASVDKEHGYLPWNWTDDQWDAAKEGFFGTLPLGGIGGARKAIFPGVGDVAAAPENGPDNTDPVAMAQLTGKNDDVPTADGIDVTNIDPQQYTQWYGEKLKSQGIDVPDATITVQTPKATGTAGGAKAGAGANVMDAAQDFMGQHMENGANGCVEAVTKIGARYNPFLADELSKGVVNVDTLVSDAGDKVVPFDPNNLEAGDVIVYGDNDHVVLADGNGGYVGNSSSQQKVVQGGDYNNMGGLKPTKIIKTGNGVTAQNETANNGNAPAADLSSLPVGDIATAIAQNTGLPANFIWAQLSHESDGGNSKLAREDHNYGGVKGTDGEYLHFDNDQQFIDYMSDYYPKYREDGIYDAQTADQFAEALQHGGYFTADLGEYEGGMHRYLEQAGLSDSGTAGAPAEKQSTVNTMTQQQFGDMLNEKMIDFAGTNDDTVKAVFNDMSTSKDKVLVNLFAPYMQDGVFANTAANRTALVNNDGFKKAMAMFLSKHLNDYAPAFENGKISFQQAEDALRPRHQVQAAQTAQAPNIHTVASPKMEAAAIQNVLSSFAQDKKNVARTEQEANLFDDMLDADDHFIDTPKNRQTLLKNYGAQLQNYVDDVMTPSLDDRVNQAIEQAIQNKDLNRMNILTQAKQANDTATLEKLVGPQTKQHVDIAAMLTPANTDAKNHVSSMMQGNALVHQTATMEHQASQNEVASTVQGNTPVQQAPATENEMPQGKVAPTMQANMPVNQAPARMDNQQAAQQDAPKEQVSVTTLPTQKGQQSEGVRIAQPQQTIDEQNAQMDARIAAIKKQPLAQRKALGQQYLDTLRQNNVSFSEKKLAESLMNGDPEAIEHVQRTYGDLLNTITPAEAAAASQHAPRTIQAATTARLGNMVSEITSGNTYKNASPVGKLAYLSAASAHAKTVGADESARAIDSIIADVRKKAGFSGKGTTEGMTPEQKDEFYNAFYKQSLDDATAIRKEAKNETPANLKSLDNTIEMFKKELANSKPTKEARKEVTHESTQSKNQQKPDEGTKNQDQHAEPEPRKAADTQRKAEESEVSATKKAADKGGRDEQTLSEKEVVLKHISTLFGKPITNKETGIVATFGTKGANKMVSNKAVDKTVKNGYSQHEHLEAVKDIKRLYEDAGLSVQHEDRDKSPNILSIKRFRTNMTTVDGNPATAKITVKETKQNGHKIYSIELEALEKPSELNHARADSSEGQTVRPTKGKQPSSAYADESSSSTHIIPHEQKEGTKNLDTGKVPAMGEPIHGIKGTETTVVTDSGKEIRVRYLAVPASRVITSHDAETMTPNKAYPQELQPRDRQRVSMQEQVTTMANELRPADLGAGRNLNQGAPIIRKDGVVLNGNGRAMAIQKATAAGGDKATAYRKYIFEHSKEFGLSRVNLAQVRKYMLVREVVDDIDANTMQDIINSTVGGSRMGASEQAKADAKKIKPSDLEQYADNENGDLTTAANRDFVASTLYRIISKSERNAYMDKFGNANADGIERVKRALFSLAYGDDGLISKMSESTDDNIRNVSRGLMSAAPEFANVNLTVKNGRAYDYDVAKTISEAVKRLDALRKEGKQVRDYLNEQSMVSEYQDTDEMRDVLRFFDDNKRSGKKIGIFLNDIANSIMMQGDPNQTSLMDGGRATLGEIIKTSARVASNGTSSADLFADVQEAPTKAKENTTQAIDDIRYSAKQNDAQVKRSLQAVVDEAKKAFPNAKNIRQDGGHISMDMPNGAEVQINVVPSIEVNNEEAGRARAAHGLKDDVRIKINGGERTVGRAALIELSQLGRKGTAYHEAFHAVYDMCLTNEEKAALHKAYDKEAKAKGRDVYEVMADKYRDWMLAQQKGQHTLFGKLWQKVKSAVIRLLHLIRGADNARDVFRKVGSGEVWERQLNSKDSGNRYLVTNDQIRPDTEVPIIDVTDEPKVNVNNHHAAADIARSMIGKTFRIIGSDGYGKIASVSDGTHFVHSSNNPVRFDKTRRKALSVAEKILGNCVYIEKHGDLKHGTKQSYIEMFSVVKDGNRLVRFRIVAKEGNKDSHAFRIGEAKFYDIIKDGALQESGVLRHYKHEGTPSTLTIAELLKGVKDREGHLYVNKDGSLNYDTRIFHNGEEQGGSPSDVRNSADLFAIRPGEPIRYSLDANDNSKPSLFTRAYNHLTGRKNAASHDKNVKAMLEDITKMRIRFGKLDPKTETVFKKFEGVIRARNANEWEKVLPEAGRAIADRLNLKPSEDMNNYIAKWLLDEATNDTSQEASDFAAALKNDPVLGDQLVDLKTLFNERNNREADEVVRDAIQYEKPKERTTLTKAWETFYDEMIEELGPVKRMVKRVQEKSGQELAASVNPYIALRLFRGNAGRAMTMIEGQSEAAVKALQTNYPGVNFNGFKTLHMILDECGALHNEKRMKDFLAFALACHVKDIHTLNNRIRKSQQRLRDKIADLNDKINNLPEYQQLIESDKKVDDKYQEQREAYQKEIEGYQAKIDKAEKTIMEVPRTEDGLSLTEDRCNKVMMKYMKEYGEAQQDLVHFSKVTTSILYDAGVISKKRYKELQERWPNYIPMFRVFEDNEEVDFGDSLKHMHGSTRRIINPLDSIIRNTYDFVKKAERNKARQLLANLTRISDVGEYIEEVDNSKPNDKTTITFYENGERKYLQTDPDIVKAVNNMGREESNWVLRLLHGPAKIARACFTTINPSFALRNLIRDSTDATIYSKYGFKPWDFVRGFLHAVHRDELFYEWLSSGAAQASAISLDRDYTQATLNQMSKTWKERLLSKEFLPAILEGMQMVGEYSEYGTRIAAYERVKKTLAGENGPHPAAYDLVSAAFESRDLMDFARGGRGSRYLNNVVVFANASIQGFDKFFRTFDFRKPYRKESMKALARLFLCGMLPALLLAGIHSGDDWWEELPDWQKETNWILGKVGNTIIRIPKGQDIGLRFFSNLIEKAMDRSKHKAGDYFRPVWDSLPDMIPTALLPIIEATANHSYFTGAPIVPKYQEKLPAYLQFGNETSSFAKFVGKVIGVSPRKVEHVLFGYTGNMGKGLLGVYDTIVGNQSLNTNLNEAPVISGFTAIPYKQSKTVNDFYDKFDEQQRLNEEFKLTKKKPDGYDPSLYKRMTKAQQELSKINKQERAAIDDPKMDSGVREQKQLGYQQQRLSVVRRVMGQ
ncbi:LPD38 domain-containing protein [Mitsuokella jalaludinii]|uniref:LPD38 domain-containing protein n=1 Tax=Mitsuokella jalaludinii TaxID=187979 RepID=UPI0020D0CD62|nr:LPD38 domain-containing protein [Mitsuokella jalaludinii]MCQ1533803.1 hypothetical protein [Mitsuokella jalaludinii]